jgi:hypothetical protein
VRAIVMNCVVCDVSAMRLRCPFVCRWPIVRQVDGSRVVQHGEKMHYTTAQGSFDASYLDCNPSRIYCKSDEICLSFQARGGTRLLDVQASDLADAKCLWHDASHGWDSIYGQVLDVTQLMESACAEP